MLLVNRSDVPIPATLSPQSETLGEARERAMAHFRRPPERRRQTRFRFDSSLSRAPDVKEALESLFHGKCAYCESRLIEHPKGGYDRFRSRGFSSNLDGSTAADHYWWLAYDWENFYAACSACGHSKGRRFPVSGERAPHGTPITEIASKEDALLLDPCRDDPDQHLAFDDGGFVGALTTRGTATIDVLSLNRPELVAARRAALKPLIDYFRHQPSQDAGLVWWGAVEQLISDSSEPYLAAKRQLVARELKKRIRSRWSNLSLGTIATNLATSARANLAETAVLSLLDRLPNVVPAAAEVKRRVREYIDTARTQSSYSVATPLLADTYFSKSRLVTGVEISNFRKIKSLRFNIHSSDTQRAPWTMFLGDNGLGKSTVLQAIGLAICGAGYLESLKLDPLSFIRHGASEASVTVTLSNLSEPLTLKIDASGFHCSIEQPKVLLLGYGATRLLPRKKPSLRQWAYHARLDNLFDPFEPVGDAQQWLSDLPQPQFDDYARALKELFFVLDGPEELIRTNGRIHVRTRNGDIPLSQLSDGYQSVIGVTADIMRVLSKYWSAMEIAEGIVLIDELGAHLHPRWRLRVVSGLRNAFPRVQFIASTHDPLCLRGLEDNEVIVLRENANGETFAILDTPPPASMRIEQLLTSELFGLYSTSDPELDAWFEEYIDFKRRPLTASSEAEERRIKSRLEQKKVLGKDRRERLMLETIDEYLVEERDLADARERAAALTRTKVSLSKIWREMVPQPIEPSTDGEAP